MYPFVRAQLCPLIIGWGVFAAIVLPGNTTWLRFVAGAVTFIVVAWGIAGRLVSRHGSRILCGQGPSCDRCGKPTGHPGLYQSPQFWWRCDSCECLVTNILFTEAEKGPLTAEMLRYTQPLSQLDPALEGRAWR